MSAKNPSEEEPKANSAPVMPEAKVSDQPASGKFEVRPKLSKSGEVDWGHGKKIYVKTLESRVSGISGYSGYNEISKLYGNLCLISETTIESKHEGGTVCYDLKRNKQPFTAATPPWLGDPADVQSKDQKSVPAAKGKQ